MVAPFTVHHMEDVGQASPRAVGFHPRPFLRFPDNLPGVAIAHMVGNHHAIAVYFHSIENPVAVFGVFAVCNTDKSVPPAHTAGGTDSIRLHHVNP